MSIYDIEIRNLNGVVVNKIGDISVFTRHVELTNNTVILNISSGDICMMTAFDARTARVKMSIDNGKVTMTGYRPPIQGRDLKIFIGRY